MQIWPALDDQQTISVWGWQTYVQESPSQALSGRLFQVRIVKHYRAVLTSQLHKTRLQILTTRSRHFAPRRRTSRKVDLLHGRMFDHSIHYEWSIIWPTANNIEYAIRQTGFFEGCR
jgi:hypothetical protein